MNINKYKDLVLNLAANGETFTRNACELSGSELTKYSDLAKSYGYKKPVLHSRGFGFYMLLQRVYNRLKDNNEI